MLLLPLLSLDGTRLALAPLFSPLPERLAVHVLAGMYRDEDSCRQVGCLDATHLRARVCVCVSIHVHMCMVSVSLIH